MKSTKVKSWYKRRDGALLVDTEIPRVSVPYCMILIGDDLKDRYFVAESMSQQAAIDISKAMGWEYQGMIGE
jgi:hypothetical protein